MYRLKIGLSLIFILFSALVYAQAHLHEKDFISIRLGNGKMMIPENKNLLNDRIPQIELTYALSYSTKNYDWLKYTRTKYQHFSLTYFNQQDLDGYNDTSKGAFGSFIGFTYSVMMELVKTKRQHVYFIPGWGFGYDTKTYYQDSKNIFIGTHLNYTIRAEINHVWDLSENISFTHCLRYYHYSNGAIVLPNRGLNTFSYLIGLQYSL